MEFGAQANDDYFVTARQIFDYCGGDSNGVLKVSVLMEKFAPFVKTNKAEFSQLGSLLDPDECNPEINVQNLADALNKYSETQKKGDLDESFNLRNGQMPQDSDSGISTDGFQLLEDLQSELREKAHLAHKLRAQLEFCDRQHEEALATLTAERDALRTNLIMLREENMSLCSVRCEYEEACERASNSERALGVARRELEAASRRAHSLQEHVVALEAEKLSLQELLSKSKEECHRINEMYASRQAALLERGEALRAQHAAQAARLHDHEELLHQLMNEKMVLETELKEAVSKCNQRQARATSVEVSYTEDQMLSVLDTMHHEHFAQEYVSVATQAQRPCMECVNRNAAESQKSFKRYFWEAGRGAAQALAGACLAAALLLLYAALRAHARYRCATEQVPWRWLDAQDLMDLFLRIEYVADVPM